VGRRRTNPRSWHLATQAECKADICTRNLLRPRRHGKSYQGCQLELYGCVPRPPRCEANQRACGLLRWPTGCSVPAPHRRHDRIRQGDMRQPRLKLLKIGALGASAWRESKSRWTGCPAAAAWGSLRRLAARQIPRAYARMTRVAAKRTTRGIIPRHRDQFSLPTQPEKYQRISRLQGHVWCARHNPDKAPRKIASSAMIMVKINGLAERLSFEPT